MEDDHSNFSTMRSILWPIHSYEMRKLFPMLVMYFLTSCNYNILRTMKDTFLVTAEHSGAEAIPFVKVWVMLPGAVLLTFIFTKLSNHYNREKVFHSMLSIFLIFFAVFAFLIYPYSDSLHLHGVADSLQQYLPAGLCGFVAIIRYWSFTLFYAMAELWSALVMSVLFWGFANDITKVCEAKRFYSLFAIGANAASIIAGQLSRYLSRNITYSYLPFGKDAWSQSVIMLTVVVLCGGIGIMAIYRWIHVNVLPDPRFYHQSYNEEDKMPIKSKMSLRKNFAYIAKSRYLLCITIIVVTYNLVINLVEVIWKSQIRELYPNPSDYNAYMNQITTLTGIIATCIAILVTSNALRKFGWTFTAMITPVVLFVTSIFFFALLLFKTSLVGVAAAFLGASPLLLVTIIGSTQNVLSRAAKYTVFDATKEMAFIPLTRQCRLKGKSAIDGIASRFGKSGGSIIHQVLLLCCGSLAVSTPFVGFFVIISIISWIAATHVLGKKVNQLEKTPAAALSVASSALETSIDAEQPSQSTV